MWQEAVVAVADRLERGTVVLVGDASTDLAPLRHPRIRLLGRRPADSMPAYVAAYDCCLIPFIQDRLTEAVNPIKLREYLGAGRPVVATPLPEVAAYADVVELAGTTEEFAAAVTRVIQDPEADTDEARARRRDRVAGETWDRAAEQVAEVLDPLLPSRGGGS
jgi:glycosyltransferase involved in cell wall biosynthesis